jgi:hypothetical protein
MRSKYYLLGYYSPIAEPKYVQPQSQKMVAKNDKEPDIIRLCTGRDDVFINSGLVSGRNDSGNRQRKGKGSHVLKTGDVYLRRALMNAVSTLLLHQPALTHFSKRLQITKPAGVARVAAARKTIGILWAVLRDQSSNTLIACKGADM